MKRKPCKTCPWRADSNTHDIPRYERALHDKLVEDCQRDGLKVMACHHSPDETPFACAGFMVQVGFDSIGVRLLVLRGLDHPDHYDAEGIDLHDTLEQTRNKQP